ncbi:MAG: PDZ domain-containing protein [Planctomycetota bacterium]
MIPALVVVLFHAVLPSNGWAIPDGGINSSLLVPATVFMPVFVDALSDEAQEQSAAQELSLDEIMATLRQLDSPRFAERERATQILSQLGEPSLRPMAFHFLQATPESSWRIRKCLEMIGTTGDEATFLKSAGLLQLLFGHSSDELQRQLRRMKHEWNEQRKQDAIAQLVSAGARVNDTTAGQGRLDFELAQLIEDGQSNMNLNGGQTQDTAPVSRLSYAQKCREIETILSSSIEENRERVLGDFPVEELNVDAAILEINGINQFDRAAVFNIRDPMPAQEAGVTVSVGPDFDGDITTFRQIENIATLRTLEIKERSVERNMLRVLSGLPSLRRLQFVGAELDAVIFERSGWPANVHSLYLEDVTIDSDMTDQITSNENLTSIWVQSCDIKRSDLIKIIEMPGLTAIQIGKFDLDQVVMLKIESQRHLRVFNIAACKFSPDDYKRLRARRPDMSINFTARAFLGVRSQINAAGCRVSDVIPGTGADKAGIQVNDVIELVDGDPILEFDDLRYHIATKDVGDEMTMTIDRNGQQLILTVLLGDIDDAPDE